jgi:hypothetical protein
VIKKPRKKNEEAKARYRAVENTTAMGCNGRKTNKRNSKAITFLSVRISEAVELFLPPEPAVAF